MALQFIKQENPYDTAGLTRTSTQGGGTLFVDSNKNYYLQGTNGFTLTTDPNIIPKTVTSAPATDMTSNYGYVAPTAPAGFTPYVNSAPDFYGRWSAFTAPNTSTLYGSKEAAEQSLGITANTPLNAIPGETYDQYQARLGKTSAGTGTGFGTPIPFTPVPSGPITSGVMTPSGTPTLPTPTAPTAQENYLTSLSLSVQNAQVAADTALKTRLDELNRRTEEFYKQQENFLRTNADPLTSPFRESLENAERERLYITENFEANQTLTRELDTLLTEGNALIQQMKGVTGLAAIREPRINQAIDATNARAGVIQAVMSARSGQIHEAYNMIDRTMQAITADRQDRLNYYNSILKLEEGKYFELTKNEREYLDEQVRITQNSLSEAQANAQYIRELLTDPESALFMANAGVSLNDSPAIVAQKIAAQSARQQVEDIKNELTQKGYEYVPFPRSTSGLTAQVIGGKTYWFKPPAGSADGGFTLSEGQTRYDANGNVIAQGTTSPTDQPSRAGNQLTFLRNTARDALVLASASGRSGARKTFESWFVGSTDYTKLEALTNTLRTNVLTLMTDPDIKKFFGPQMSEADVRLMTAAGTTLNPELQGPEQMTLEIQRLDNLLGRMQEAVGAGQAAGRIIIAPDGTEIEITD